MKGFLKASGGSTPHKVVKNVVAKGKGVAVSKGNKPAAKLSAPMIKKGSPIPSHAVARSVNKVPAGKATPITGKHVTNFIGHSGKMPGTC